MHRLGTGPSTRGVGAGFVEPGASSRQENNRTRRCRAERGSKMEPTMVK